jgi:broad specificity phosphatase PhoE
VRLLLLRHGETTWSAEHRYQGVSDTLLSDLGRAQVAALAGRLRGESFTEFRSSPLRRALDTAAAVAAQHDAPLVVDERLREIGLGRWEGLAHEEIQRQAPERYAGWLTDPAKTIPPEGEAMEAVMRRVGDLWREMASRPDDVTLALVGHGACLRALLCLALEVPTAAFWRFQLGAASVSELYIHSRGAKLVLLNDLHHLNGTGTPPPGALPF